ncbi:MAG TPA: chromate resistance protein ChrB domain-containing protein [Chthoniobacterales bacterium]
MSETWILLLYALPKGKGPQRVALWRQLRRHGCLALNTSAYILPDRHSCHEHLQWLAKQILDGGGEATVSKVLVIEGLDDQEIQRRFNAQRNAEYVELLKEASALRKRKGPPTPLLRKLDRLKHLAKQALEIDYFGASKGRDLDDVLRQLEEELRGDPRKDAPQILDQKQYLKRVWITRPNPEIDRCASAWLIRKFIDPKATFQFTAQKPRRGTAVTFDMLDADFTHQGDSCTFETLCLRFAINDPIISQIAEMVHDADLEDEKFDRKEAVGIDLMLKGLAQMKKSSDEILAAGISAVEALFWALKSRHS